MLEENSNLKSHIKDTSHLPSIGKVEIFRLGSYNKTNKLVSALYMVTDIMDKEEPLRIKLRNLGTNIISDIHSLDKGQALYNRIDDKVSEILSFLEIASSVGVVSNMNSSILMKEFIDLRKSISEIVPKEDQNWLEEFMKEGQISEREILEKRAISIGQASTRIGVQKGSTLLQALSKVGGKIVSDRTQKIVNSPTDNNGQHAHSSNSFRNENNDLLKNKRREEIISIIKDKASSSLNFDGVTITDIKSIGQGVLLSCGEKTLQRELVSMVSDGVLKKIGEKRWSKYNLKN